MMDYLGLQKPIIPVREISIHLINTINTGILPNCPVSEIQIRAITVLQIWYRFIITEIN